jgi:hypothetical protein
MLILYRVWHPVGARLLNAFYGQYRRLRSGRVVKKDLRLPLDFQDDRDGFPCYERGARAILLSSAAAGEAFAVGLVFNLHRDEMPVYM